MKHQLKFVVQCKLTKDLGKRGILYTVAYLSEDKVRIGSCVDDWIIAEAWSMSPIISDEDGKSFISCRTYQRK